MLASYKASTLVLTEACINCLCTISSVEFLEDGNGVTRWICFDDGDAVVIENENF